MTNTPAHTRIACTPQADAKAPRLYRRVKERMFKELVRPLLPDGGEMPSKKELAERYGVNVGTLDKALQELEHEGYIEKRVGSGTYVLPRGAHGEGDVGIYTRCPCVTANWKSRLFYDRLNSMLQEELGAAGRGLRHYADMRIDSARGAPPSLRDDINQGSISSIVAFGIDEEGKSWLPSAGVPVVAHDYDFGWGCTGTDMMDGGFAAASALIAAGCQNIELLSGNVHEWLRPDVAAKSNRPLRAGMANAMREAGLPPPECWLRPEMLQESGYDERCGIRTTEEAGYEICKLLFRHRTPDGVVIYPDVFAIGVATALKERGLTPGRDIHAAVLCNEELDFPELAGFIRLELSIKEIASSLVSLLAAAERGEEPRELRVKFKAVQPSRQVS